MMLDHGHAKVRTTIICAEKALGNWLYVGLGLVMMVEMELGVPVKNNTIGLGRQAPTTRNRRTEQNRVKLVVAV